MSKVRKRILNQDYFKLDAKIMRRSIPYDIDKHTFTVIEARIRRDFR